MSKREEYETNQSFFRLIGNYTWVNGSGFAFKPQIRMKIRLKALQRRVSIIILGENDDETNSSTALAATAENAPLIAPARQSTRIGFQYTALDWLNSRFDADIVVNSKLVPEPSLRARQKLYSSPRTLSRFTVTGFWEQKHRFGQTTQVDYAHQFARKWAYDITLKGTQSQDIPELAWDNIINTAYQISSRDGLALHLEAFGPTRPHAMVQNYHSSVVYRRNFYRSWMFYEIEPGVDWPYINSHRHPVLSTAFRLEFQFKNF